MAQIERIGITRKNKLEASSMASNRARLDAIEAFYFPLLFFSHTKKMAKES